MAMTGLLYVARHGETDWNVEGRWQGRTDVPLNDRGRAQARELGELLKREGIAAVASSDLSRARETAEITAEVLGARFAYADPDLRERGFGLFEGLTRDECADAHPEAWRVWITDARIAPPGAETYEALAARVANATRRALLTLAGDGPALLVTHGGSLRAILARVTGSLEAAIPNGAVYVLSHDGERFLGASAFHPER
jgi:probable phosphoglycerate mutase